MAGGGRDELAPGVARERGWGRTLVAYAAAIAVGAAAAWAPPAQPLAALVGVLVPVRDVLLLAVPALAACALVGWWAGGRLTLAVAWTAVAVLLVAWPGPSAASAAYQSAARGWALLLAAAFGAACVVAGPSRPFIGRAMSAVAVAFVVGTASMVVAGRRPAEVSGVAQAEYARRVDRALAVWRRHARGPAWRRVADGALAERAAAVADRVAQLPPAAVRAMPALLALESVAALALAWSLYHRLARVRLGPPLARLAEFRFNDQLVWGVVAGATLVALPSFAEYRPLGLNLLVFFGALYALRGLGVLRWWADRRVVHVGAAAVVLAAVLLVPLVGVTAPALLLGAAALALGLGDTVAGWRARARPEPAAGSR